MDQRHSTDALPLICRATEETFVSNSSSATRCADTNGRDWPTATFDDQHFSLGIYDKIMTKLDTLDTVTKWAESDLDDRYTAVLRKHGGTFCNETVRLYGIDEIVDRNEVFETKKYCPGFLAIADDSGGRAVLIALGRFPSPVYLVDHGLMDEDDFAEIAPDIDTWLERRFAVD